MIQKVSRGGFGSPAIGTGSGSVVLGGRIRYTGKGDASALGETAGAFTTQHTDSVRAKKASVWRAAKAVCPTMSHSGTLSRLTVRDRRIDMIRWALRKAIDKFERDWDYDASYMRDMIDASPRAAWLFARVTDAAPL
jgi:hypothetical protein